MILRIFVAFGPGIDNRQWLFTPGWYHAKGGENDFMWILLVIIKASSPGEMIWPWFQLLIEVDSTLKRVFIVSRLLPIMYLRHMIRF